MPDAIATLKLLVLAGPGDRTSPLVELLKSHHEVITARTLEEAVGELRGGNIDAVISESADFLRWNAPWSPSNRV